MTAESTSGMRIADDVLDEARRLALEAGRRGVPMRLLGGAAIQLRSRGRIPPALERAPRDIDVIAAKGAQPELTALLEESGYRADEAFNRLEGARRLLFRDEAHDRQLDVFVHHFEMCHDLRLGERLEAEPVTLPLAELALTKLQIVELNAKDRTDLYALLCAHDVGRDDGGGATLNAARMAELCAADWGLWRTCTLNLARLREGLTLAGLGPDERRLVGGRLAALEDTLEAEPKSRRWKLRARVGERVRWFKTPDEILET